MARFAAHYLYLPQFGFLKQGVVETTPEGSVSLLSLLTEEQASVAWFPGVIGLCVEADLERFRHESDSIRRYFHSKKRIDLSASCLSLYNNGDFSPVLFSPFDFISMQPVDETRHRLLR